MRNQLLKLQGFKKTNDDLKNEREEIDKKREEVLANAGLVSSTASHVFNADSNTINLINISDDPSISNWLVYFMHNSKNTLGTDNENKVVLKGLGISDKHAILTNDNDDKLFIEPLDYEVWKVLVNGKQISNKTELHHLDRVVFGHGNAFKVVIPLHKDEAIRSEEAIDYNSIMHDRLANDTTEAKNMRKYLEELRERLGENKGMQFVIKFQQALDELDEANEYSKARYMAFPLDKNYIIFTIEIMVDIKEYEVHEPEIVVRWRSRNTNEILFLWSYIKFKQRLELMTEWYADLKDDGVLNKDYTIDPWIDISDEDIKRKVDEQKEMANDKINKLKQRLENEK